MQDGGDVVHLRAQLDDLGWFAWVLARLPFSLEIVSPNALGTALAAHARVLIARSGGTS